MLTGAWRERAGTVRRKQSHRSTFRPQGCQSRSFDRMFDPKLKFFRPHILQDDESQRSKRLCFLLLDKLLFSLTTKPSIMVSSLKSAVLAMVLMQSADAGMFRTRLLSLAKIAGYEPRKAKQMHLL